jgi:hypothetical protein
MTDSGIIEWTCDECRQAIANGEGMLWADVVAAEIVGSGTRRTRKQHHSPIS